MGTEAGIDTANKIHCRSLKNNRSLKIHSEQ